MNKVTSARTDRDFTFPLKIQLPKELASCEGSRSTRSLTGTNVAQIPKAAKRIR